MVNTKYRFEPPIRLRGGIELCSVVNSSASPEHWRRRYGVGVWTYGDERPGTPLHFFPAEGGKDDGLVQLLRRYAAHGRFPS